MSCCAACDQGSPCSGGSCSAASAGHEHVGDNTGRDIGHAVATVDRGIDRFWQSIKGELGVYGQIIDVAHQARMDALQQHAPEFYPPDPPAPTGPSSLAPGQFLGIGLQGTRAQQGETIARMVTAQTPKQRVLVMRFFVRSALDGEASSKRYLATVKERAAAGDPDARRKWKAALLLMQEKPGATSKKGRAK